MTEEIEEQLDEREALFVEAYLAPGGLDAAKAARAAGYSPTRAKVQGHTLLKRPRIRAAIRREAERRLQSGVALAADVLVDLAKNAKNESVKLKAATALLDHGGMPAIVRSEHTVVVKDQRSDAELRQHVQRLAADLGLDAKVIDGVVAPAALLKPARRPVVDVEASEVPAADDASVEAPRPDEANDGLPGLFE